MTVDMINYTEDGQKLITIEEKLLAEGKESSRDNVKPLADKIGVNPKFTDSLFIE